MADEFEATRGCVLKGIKILEMNGTCYARLPKTALAYLGLDENSSVDVLFDEKTKGRFLAIWKCENKSD